MLIALIIVSSLLGITVVALGIAAFLFYYLFDDWEKAEASRISAVTQCNQLATSNNQQTLQIAQMKVERDHYLELLGQKDSTYKPKQHSHSASIKNAEDVVIYE